MKKLFIVVNVDYFFLSHRKEIALAAKEEGYDVTIVTKITGNKTEIILLGLKVIDLPMSRSGKNIFKEIATLRFLYKLYRNEKPDIVHHVGSKTILWGTLAAKFAKVKAIVNAVSGLGVFFSGANTSIVTKFLLLVLRYSHTQDKLAVIFQNNEDKSLYLSNHIIVPIQAYLIKGSGVNLNEYCYTQEPDEGKIKVILTARMIFEKGIFDLIDAAKILKNDYKNKVQFLLCGGIDDNPKAIREEDLRVACDGEYISWLGHRDDVLDLLKSSHIVVLPSYYKEGLPKSLIEASAIGRPIITTNSVGCKETVLDGYNGYLVPVKNSLELSRRLKILFDDSQLRINMGRNSRLLAEKDFDINQVIRKTLRIYTNLLDK